MSNIQATVDRVYWGHAAIEYAGGQRSSFEYGAASKRDDAAVPMSPLQQKRAPPKQLKDVSHTLAGMVRWDQLHHRAWYAGTSCSIGRIRSLPACDAGYVLCCKRMCFKLLLQNWLEACPFGALNMCKLLPVRVLTGDCCCPVVSMHEVARQVVDNCSQATL